METEPRAYIDVVLTSDRELYVRPGQCLDSARGRKTIIEMLCGWSAVNSRGSTPAKLREPTQENWERAIGLVICGLAERIQL